MANASELCYLTQVVIRLFEDTQKPSEDPRRFRVEILFSPGATATPLHMAELYRENDATRFDTEKLQKISIDGLTCAQVEEYFTEALKEGKTHDEDDDTEKAPVGNKKDKVKQKKDKAPGMEAAKQKEATKDKKGNDNGGKATGVGIGNVISETTVSNKTQSNVVANNPEYCADDPEIVTRDPDSKSVGQKSDNYWRSATVFGVVIGVGCLFMMSRATRGMKSRQ